ncbi:MAG TPA: sialate O-acetylesterase [Kiritimatiellia bacterium]|nr:sialate O-acetylesterase [Kiritimatiellia bacterium]
MLAVRVIRSVFLGLLVPAFALFAKEPSDLELFLLIGQSNMAGRGKVEPADQVPNPRILMLDKTNAWVPAIDPVHFDKPKIAGVGLASEFARRVAAAQPEAVVGLVPCAFGGTSLDQWRPGSDLYTNAVARARVAMRNGKLRAILWHQGEADCSPTKTATYPERFSKMIAQLRSDLNVPDVPVLVGELGRYRDTYAGFNTMLPQVIQAVPNSASVSSEGLGANQDNVHFSREALIEFGARYFEAYERLRKGTAQR